MKKKKLLSFHIFKSPKDYKEVDGAIKFLKILQSTDLACPLTILTISAIKKIGVLFYFCNHWKHQN